MRNAPIILAIATRFLFWSACAQAQTVSVHFYTDTHTNPSDALATTDVAGAETAAAAHWNNVDVSSGNSPISGSSLVDNTGASTPLTFSLNPDGGGANVDGPGGQTATQKLYGSGRDCSASSYWTTTLQVTNVPYAAYNIYLYFNDGYAGRYSSFAVGSTAYYASTNAVYTKYARATSTTAGTYTASNYVKFTGLTGSSQTITGTALNNSGSTNYAGFQIEPVMTTAGSVPAAPSFASNYKLAWSQDYTTMSQLSQLNAVGGYTMGSGTWIAHTPGHQDWFTFIDPVDNNDPFGLSSGYLDVRVANRGYGDPNNWFGGYSGGLLSSVDSGGHGFAQQYGYFECSMWCPGGANTWPAFWLQDAASLTANTPAGAEVDVTESYGNYGTGPNQSPAGNPNENGVTWHDWGHGSNPTTSNGTFVACTGMTSGYHTYGVDIEPTNTTWYFDRNQIWQAPTVAGARSPMYILLDLALGGGNYNNAGGTGYNWSLTPNPSDLKVRYVAVYASPNSPNYNTAAAIPGNVVVTAGSGHITLAWGVAANAGSYNVYRGTQAGGEAAVPIASGMTATTYVDSATSSGTTYYYTVKAVGVGGASASSGEASAQD